MLNISAVKGRIVAKADYISCMRRSLTRLDKAFSVKDTLEIYIVMNRCSALALKGAAKIVFADKEAVSKYVKAQVRAYVFANIFRDSENESVFGQG